MSKFAIKHTFPGGHVLGDGYVHSGNTFPQPIAPYYAEDEAQQDADTMNRVNPGHTFEVVPYPA